MNFFKSLFFGSPEKKDLTKKSEKESESETSEPEQPTRDDDSAAELRNFQQAIDRLVEAEYDEYLTALARLEKLSETAFKGKRSDYIGVSKYLSNAHEKAARMFELCQVEVQGAGSSRISHFTDLTKAAVTSPGLAAPNYSYFLENIVTQVAQGIPAWQEPLFSDEDFVHQLKNIIRMQAASKVKKDAEPAIEKKQKLSSEQIYIPVPKPKTIVIRTLSGIVTHTPPPSNPNACQTCGVELTSVNHCPVPDHSSCFVCITCIRTRNFVKLLCPVCQFRYADESKSLLNKMSPGLIAILKANKRNNYVKGSKSKRNPDLCDTCDRNCVEQPTYHQCADGKKRCLDCEKGLLACNCFHKKKLICPKCNEDQRDLYDSTLKCYNCRRRIMLNQIAHWCTRIKGYIFCENCEPECGCEVSSK